MSGRKEKGASALCRKRLFFTIIYAEVFHSHLLMNTEKLFILSLRLPQQDSLHSQGRMYPPGQYALLIPWSETPCAPAY